MTIQKYDVIIIGAGAAGLMCAITAGNRGRKVIVLDHANKPGKKILMSGGGRCNFTNYHIAPEKFISHNRHFCKSALSRYTQWDFIELVKKHGIPFHEKSLGQLFCDHKSKDIVNMLLKECEQNNVTIKLNTRIETLNKLKDHHYKLQTTSGDFHCESVVVATGGLSIPTMGASPFAYKIAEQFDIHVYPTRAGLVPFTLHDHDKAHYSKLSGVSTNVIASNAKIAFEEALLFTHRGLSGPAMLQISSYWQPGEAIKINFIPNEDIFNLFITLKQKNSQQLLKNILIHYLPKRVIPMLSIDEYNKPINQFSDDALTNIASDLKNFSVKPNGTEGYRTAEVTIGGVDCNAISSKTLEVNKVAGLFFIGEAVDVTGWLGGYNFQWAWSSGYAAGLSV